MIRLFVLPAMSAALALTPAPHQPAPTPDRLEADVFEAANGFRVENGLPALRPNPILAADARAYAEYLASTGKFSHTADGRDPGQRARAAGYDYCNVSENLVYEQDDADLGAERVTHIFMSEWEASPGHRRNLLDPDVRETGVGVARAPGRVNKYVAVQEFGRSASQRYSFRVENQTDGPVSYEFDGARRTVPPQAVMAATTCSSGDIRFERVWSAQSRYAAEPGTSYVLTQAPGGVNVTVVRPQPRNGRSDPD
jgi:uncharacterized protein YkwD